MKQNIQLQQVQRNQINHLASSRRKQTTDFTRGQQINVRNPLTGLWMPAVIAEKRQEPMSYDVQIGNRIIRRAHHHIRKAYTPPLHTPPPYLICLYLTTHPSRLIHIPCRNAHHPLLPQYPHYPQPCRYPHHPHFPQHPLYPQPCRNPYHLHFPQHPHHSPILTSHTLQVSL